MARMGVGMAIAVAAIALGGLVGCAVPPPAAPPAPMMGVSADMGKGRVSSYAEVDATGAPKAIGMMFPAAALGGLPEGTDRHHCYDINHNGRIEPGKECLPAFERVIPLPSGLAARDDMPFKWVLLNWNPVGHLPPGVYDRPHFDVHFVIEPIENIFAIKEGPCGEELISCADLRTGRKPVPGNYVPASHIDVGAVVPAMGNHLIDVNGPEFKGQKFTRAFIYGAYDGRVTFYEDMVTRDYMMSKPDQCDPIPQPEAVAVAGYYPTQSCVRYLPATDTYTVSLEGFRMRPASPPTAPRPAPKPPAKPVHHH